MDLLGRFDLGEFGDPRSDAAEKKLLADPSFVVAGRYYEPEKAVRPGPLTPPRGTPSPVILPLCHLVTCQILN